MKKKLQDYVWQKCLPKEFKEEVKYEYSRVATKVIKTNYDLGFMNAHEGMYGIHNLTSDAEGEDEMLCVSRKNVQKMYSYNEDELSRDPTNKGALLLKLRLEALFGSKCLPDEEPKPAEPKFKVGDIVRFKYCCTTYRIDGFKMSDGVMLYQVGEVWAEESDLEPYTEPTANYMHSEGDLNTAVLTGKCSSASTCDKQFDTIVKDSFRNERRLNIAARIVASMVGSDDWTTWRGGSDKEIWHNMAKSSLEIADALIAECEKKGDSK